MLEGFGQGTSFGWGLVVVYLCFKILEASYKKSKDRYEARPDYIINGLPLYIVQGNRNHSFYGVTAHIFTVREGDETIRVDNPGDLNFIFNNSEGREFTPQWDNSQGEKSYLIQGDNIPVYGDDYHGKVNFYCSDAKGKLEINSVTPKKGVTIRALLIESFTEEEEYVYWFYGDGIDAKVVSKDNPTLKKYKKLVSHSVRYRDCPEENMS